MTLGDFVHAAAHCGNDAAKEMARQAEREAERQQLREWHAAATAAGVPMEAPCECCGEETRRRIHWPPETGETWAAAASFFCTTCYMGDCPACEDRE